MRACLSRKNLDWQDGAFGRWMKMAATGKTSWPRLKPSNNRLGWSNWHQKEQEESNVEKVSAVALELGSRLSSAVSSMGEVGPAIQRQRMKRFQEAKISGLN
ncbi:hypothetical protein GX51_00868 [Blastomyces parvus]|uniref:Uncharacterized protein n=1 Tax=Blastomyces parvus TaxID=2060905 RepID=A0A2B7XBT3_9EURO|nr:hypothetical protein GX51_00868 [Blastomyces parvus]